MVEKFQIPGVAGIIERDNLGTKEILIQERVKQNAPDEKGLIEIPAGKIREFENMTEIRSNSLHKDYKNVITETINQLKELKS